MTPNEPHNTRPLSPDPQNNVPPTTPLQGAPTPPSTPSAPPNYPPPPGYAPPPGHQPPGYQPPPNYGAPQGPYGRVQISPQDERTWAMAAHLSALVLGFLGPLLVWLIKGQESAFVLDQSKEALNFQISISIYLAISFVLCFVFIGFLLFPVVALANFILLIVGGIAANNGQAYRYPMTLRLIS